MTLIFATFCKTRTNTFIQGRPICSNFPKSAQKRILKHPTQQTPLPNVPPPQRSPSPTFPLPLPNVPPNAHPPPPPQRIHPPNVSIHPNVPPPLPQRIHPPPSPNVTPPPPPKKKPNDDVPPPLSLSLWLGDI